VYLTNITSRDQALAGRIFVFNARQEVAVSVLAMSVSAKK
jgi:hypothetical protein